MPTATTAPASLVLPQNLCLTEGSLFEGFEAASDWSPVVAGDGSAANDTTNYKQGTQSVRFTAGANGRVRMDKPISASPTTGTMRLYRIPNYVNQAPSLFLSNDPSYAKYFQANLVGMGRVGFWTVHNVVPSDWVATGGMSWTDSWARIRYQLSVPQGVQDTADNWMVGVHAQGAVMLDFDDGLGGVYNYALPAMRARKIRGTAYVVTDLVGTAGYMTPTQLVALDSGGWSVANHTTDHSDLTTLDQATAQAKLSGAANALSGWGLSANAYQVAYPYGKYNASVLAAMAATSMLTGRTTDGDSTMVMPYPDYRLIPSKPVTAATSLQTVKGYIDLAKSRGEILSLYMHDIVSGGATGNQVNVSVLEAILDYIVAQQIPPITIADLHALRSGPVSVISPW